MAVALMGLGLICYLAALVTSIIILIEAFQDETWKGVVGLLCGAYLFYYMLFELDHDRKWLLVAVALGGGALGMALMKMGSAMTGPLPAG